jgi:hypothetical protein
MSDHVLAFLLFPKIAPRAQGGITMIAFYIQEQENTDALTRVGHDEFYETLNDGSG